MADRSNRIEAPTPTPILVMVESPYSASDKYTVEQNVEYALSCMKDSYARGEAPMLTHLLYTRIPAGEHVSDYETQHHCMSRNYGLLCASEWRKVCAKTILYVDHGVSAGMERAENEAFARGQPVERRRLGDMSDAVTVN